MTTIPIRIWDLPTRVFHWTLAACVAGALATAWLPGTWIEWHARLGEVVLALLAFRLAWGVVGGRWSRFSSFLPSPRAVLAHFRGRGDVARPAGHNPAGALSVLSMLVVLLAQVATGLVIDDEIAFTGPLNRYVAGGKALAATWYHRAIGQWLVLALVALHLVAVVYYVARKREPLVRAMVQGDKAVPPGTPASADGTGPRLLALAVFAACAGAVWWLMH